MESFHHRLHQAMQQKHITQSDLCAKTGISRSTMSQYCSGAFRPKDSKLHAIAKALGVKETWLLGYESEEEPSFSLEDYPNLRPIRLKRFPLLGEIACGEPIFAQGGSGDFSHRRRRDRRRFLSARPWRQHDRRTDLRRRCPSLSAASPWWKTARSPLSSLTMRQR